MTTDRRGPAGFLARFAADRRGATVVEYGLIAGLIFVVIVAAVSAMGVGLGDSLGSTSEAVTAATGGGAPAGDET